MCSTQPFHISNETRHIKLLNLCLAFALALRGEIQNSSPTEYLRTFGGTLCHTQEITCQQKVGSRNNPLLKSLKHQSFGLLKKSSLTWYSIRSLLSLATCWGYLMILRILCQWFIVLWWSMPAPPCYVPWSLTRPFLWSSSWNPNKRDELRDTKETNCYLSPCAFSISAFACPYVFLLIECCTRRWCNGSLDIRKVHELWAGRLWQRQTQLIVHQTRAWNFPHVPYFEL